MWVLYILVMFILNVSLFLNFILDVLSHTDSYNKYYKYKIIGIQYFVRHNNIWSHEITSS